MHRRLLLASCLGAALFASPGRAQELTPEHQELADPVAAFDADAVWDGMVDKKTTYRILDFLNGVDSYKQIVEETGLAPETAQLILEIRKAQKTGTLTSLAQLQKVWSFDVTAFAKLHCFFGPATKGRWDLLPYEAPWSPVNTVLLKNGRVMFFEESNSVRTTQWDPSDLVNPIFVSPDNDPQFSQWCSQTVQLSDGRVLSVGGAGGGPNPNSDQVHIFDPDAGTNGVWTRIADLNFERWYPSVVALGEPNFLIVGGVQSGGGGTVGPMEIYNENTGAFTVVPGASSELFWTPLYPGLHPLANGQIVFTRTGFAGSPATPPTQFFVWNDFTNPVTGTWHDLGPLAFPYRTEAMSLQFMEPTDDVYEQRSRVMVFGGGQTPIPDSVTAEIIDAESLAVGAPWTRLPDMAEPRNHAQSILLPDGKAIIWGGANHGNNGLVGSFSSELFDPCTNTFICQDDLTFARGYHSAAALLPSGKVLASGGIAGPLEKTMEVYSPPYLFKGPRPVISSYPSVVKHGDKFDIKTPQATQIEKVVLVRPVQNTHSTDSEQRVLQLRFTRDLAAGKVTATMPDGVAPHPHAPRGHYLLFILNCRGVPSIGKFVYLY
ncbi:MAG: galactose oxidase early set domain-containing protein [Planctomycetota bacterium]